VLIHAGAEAVGRAAIQLAKHLGLQVITTASTASIKFVRGLGADTVIDRKTQHFQDAVRNMDAVLDSVGMENLLLSFRSVKRGGPVVSISDGPDVALARHRRVSPLLWPVLAAMGAKPHMAARRAGANYRSWFMRADGLQLESLNPLLEVGVVRPHIDRVSPFAQTAQAIAYAEAGKVVLQMQPN
jgi:NADPH:quinone reductase-like Zn-dependent oxidoreductase